MTTDTWLAEVITLRPTPGLADVISITRQWFPDAVICVVPEGDESA